MAKPFIAHAFLAATLLVSSAPTPAQNNAAGTVSSDPSMDTTTADPLAANTMAADPMTTDPMATNATTSPYPTDPAMNATEEHDDNDFPWGLLGLLGLAGLMGRKRRDDDVHVDTARHDTR